MFVALLAVLIISQAFNSRNHINIDSQIEKNETEAINEALKDAELLDNYQDATQVKDAHIDEVAIQGVLKKSSCTSSSQCYNGYKCCGGKCYQENTASYEACLNATT